MNRDEALTISYVRIHITEDLMIDILPEGLRAKYLECPSRDEQADMIKEYFSGSRDAEMRQLVSFVDAATGHSQSTK